MKRLFLFFLLLSAVHGMGNEFPSGNQEIVGEWQGYILNHGEITSMSPYTYHLLPSGKWSIREGMKAEIPQGWYKTDRNTLFLQPLQTAQAKQNLAISAQWKSKQSFEISDPMSENQGLLFLKGDSVKNIQLKEITGKWKMMQKDLSSKEVRTAPFFLFFNSNYTYQAKQEGKKLPREWSEGTFEISGSTVSLKNKNKEAGLWHNPSFFLLNGQLRYNNRKYCLWCEHLQEK